MKPRRCQLDAAKEIEKQSSCPPGEPCVLLLSSWLGFSLRRQGLATIAAGLVQALSVFLFWVCLAMFLSLSPTPCPCLNATVMQRFKVDIILGFFVTCIPVCLCI